MLKVFKYTIPTTDYFSLNLPQGAQILTVQTQYEIPNIWALVNPNNPKEERKFRLAGTGHPIEESNKNLIYIGTFQLVAGSFIGRLFELNK